MPEKFNPEAFGVEFGLDGEPTAESVMRAWAQWYLGYRDWGTQFFNVYNHPAEYLQRLQHEVEKPYGSA